METIRENTNLNNNKLNDQDFCDRFAGMFKDDPQFDEFVEEMAAYRRKIDAEMAAYENSLEKNE